MDIREQVMADDVRREFRAGDLDVLMAILRAEGAGDDAGGGLVAGGGKPLDMQTRIGGGYPFGREWGWGITFSGVDLIVWSGKLYHGWREIDWAGPADPAAPTPQVTGLTDGQTVYIRYALAPALPWTPKVDFVATASYAAQAGYVLRALVTVGVARGRAYLVKWWGGGLDTGLMGDRP